MSTPLKQHKHTEGRVHEHLYQNVVLLTEVYPTSRDFDMVFKRDMFVKSNKTAFHQVIYYLLNILNPQLTEQKITAWPLYDVKLESKFRSEVLSYINELNSIYPDASIPNIMASHLITPGGYKFVKFMFILSQFVLFEHLKKINAISLISIKPHKDPGVTNIIIKNLKAEITAVEASMRQLYENFNRQYEDASARASGIVFEQTQLNQDIDILNQALTNMKNSFKSSTKESLVLKLDELRSKIIDLRHVQNLCKTGDELLTCFSSKDSVLMYNREDVIVPKNIAHLFNESEVLDLHALFKGLISVLENESMKMPTFTKSQLDGAIKIMEELNGKYSHFHRKLITTQTKLIEIFDKEIVHPEIKSQKHQCPIIKINLFENETFAKPLEDSETSQTLQIQD